MKNNPMYRNNNTYNNRLQRFIYSFKGYKKHLGLTLMFIPVVVYFFIFKYIPMYGITLAFKEYNLRLGILGSPWVGFKHFDRLFRTYQFTRALRNTVIISLLRLIIGFPMPIILALLLNEVRNIKFKKPFKPSATYHIFCLGLYSPVFSHRYYHQVMV